jgi:hypothetical protein
MSWIKTAVVTLALVGFASAANAQGKSEKAHNPRNPPPPRATPAMPAVPAVHEGKPAETPKAKPAVHATPSPRAVAKRQQPGVKVVKTEAKRVEHAQAAAVKDALKIERHERSLLGGVHLTRTQRTQTRGIEKKYDAQYRELRRSYARTHDASIAQRITQLDQQERAELRAVLSGTQTARFDRNASRIK